MKLIITLMFTSSIVIAQYFLLFGNEEKLVALLAYSSFVRVALVVSGMVPYSLVVEVFFAQMRSDSRIIPYSLQHGSVIVVVTSPG